jgi:hypothetical protein
MAAVTVKGRNRLDRDQLHIVSANRVLAGTDVLLDLLPSIMISSQCKNWLYINLDIRGL